MKSKVVLSIASVLALLGCASVLDGTSQEIVVNTTPDGSYCKLLRQGQPIGEITKTPGAVTIKKTKYDMTIECEKDGFYKSTFYDKSGVNGSTWGNIILGGGIGWAVDSAAGADNKYTTPVNIAMVPLSTGTPPAPVYSEPPKEEKKDESKDVKPGSDTTKNYNQGN